MRQKGSRNTLVRIDYDVIGQLAGIAGDTAKQYAHRGEYDPRSLESILSWINGRRSANELPLIGLPSENATDAEDCADGGSYVRFASTLPTPSLSGGYDPLLGGYRTDGIMGGNAFIQ
jgi:hypothetical protein